MEITFRRITRADFGFLARWLAEPHVARWWYQEFTAEAVERDFGPSADRVRPNEDHMVMLGRRPIGLMQCAKWTDCPEYRAEIDPVYPVPDDSVTIDYLIGEPELIGRGIGTAMIRAFTERFWHADSAAPCIVVTVVSANLASWRALLSAGFHFVARGDLPPENPIDDALHEVLRLDRPRVPALACR